MNFNWTIKRYICLVAWVPLSAIHCIVQLQLSGLQFLQMKSWDRIRIIHYASLNNTGQTQNYSIASIKDVLDLYLPQQKESFQTLSPFYASEILQKFKYKFLKLYQNSDYLFLFSIHQDWPNGSCTALSWVNTKVRIYAQSLCTSPVFKSQDDSHSRYRLRYVPWTYSTKTTTNSREQEKNPGWDFLFYSLQSQEHLSNQGLAINKCNIWILQQLKEKKEGKKSISVQTIFFNNSKVTKTAVRETNQIIRIMELTFRNTVIKMMGNK